MRKLLLVLILLLSACTAPMRQALPTATISCPNPQYEGFGANATGGQGQPVYHVTTLSDSGAGSLRTALSGDNRCIVFDVSGTINLSSVLRVKNNVTIDGLSSPNGITLQGQTLIMDGGVSNIIVRGIRVRGASDDNIRVYGNAHDIVIDHVSSTGFCDGAIDVTEGSHNVTLSWNIMGDGCSAHDFSNLIGYKAYNVTVHHNLYILSDDRQPLCHYDDAGSTSSATTCDIVNNLVWGYKWHALYVLNGSNANAINNYWYSSSNPGQALLISNGKLFSNGNISKNNYSVAGNVVSRFSAPSVTTQEALTAAQLILANAGARGENFGLDTQDVAYINRVALSPTTPTKTYTPTPTYTLTSTMTMTPTKTTTRTPTQIPSPTVTMTKTNTSIPPTVTMTHTITPTSTSTPTQVAMTITPTMTPAPTPTYNRCDRNKDGRVTFWEWIFCWWR